MDQTILYRGRPFRLNNAGAITLMRRAVARHHAGDESTARRLVSLAVRIEAGLCTSAEAFDAADAVGPRIHAEGVTRGLFSRTRGDAYQIAPPIVSSDQTIDRCVEILAESTKAVLG